MRYQRISWWLWMNRLNPKLQKVCLPVLSHLEKHSLTTYYRGKGKSFQNKGIRQQFYICILCKGRAQKCIMKFYTEEKKRFSLHMYIFLRLRGRKFISLRLCHFHKKTGVRLQCRPEETS